MDPRVATTRAALIGAVLEELNDTDVAGLTVASICARGGVSRVAFYDRFGTIDALLVAAMEGELDRVRAAAASMTPKGDRPADEPPSDLVEMFRIIGEHAALFHTMLSETGSAAFLHRMRESIRSAVAATLHRLPGADEWPIDQQYYFDYIAGAAVSVVLGWLEREPDEHPDRIAKQLWWLIAHRPDAARPASA